MAGVIELQTLTVPQRALAVAGATLKLSRRCIALAFGRGQWRPFNGQDRRIETMVNLIATYQPDAIIETGSYTGSTTMYLASFGTPVFSIEIMPDHYYIARFRMRKCANVTLALGASARLLEWLRGGNCLPISRPLFYLDAHWGEDLPLRQELDQIWNGWAEAVVVIDDFKVPHDSGFGYDDYGPGKVIDLELCSPPPSVCTYWPNHSAGEESGHRRGASYMGVGPAATEALDQLAKWGMIFPHRD